MNTSDKRYIKNEKLIRETFIEMLRDMKYNQITVNALCDRALISKHTFYSHYESKEDLTKSLMDELFEGMTVSHDNYVKYIKTSGVYSVDKNTIVELQNSFYEYVNANFDSFYVFFKHDETICFSQRMAYFIKKRMLKNTSETAVNNIKFYMVLDYILFGDVSIIKNWVLNRDKMDLKEVKKFAETILISAHVDATEMYLTALKNKKS